MFAADVNQVNMEMDLIKILSLSNLLTAAFDTTGRESIYKTRSRINGYRKKINADVTSELLNLKRGIKAHSFDEETISFIKHLCESCAKDRTLLDWEYDCCGFESEREVADALLQTARRLYRSMY